MHENEAVRLFKCLADLSRVRIIKALMQEDMYAERLAERLGLTAATISFHMKKLEDAGMVTSRKEQYYTMYALNRDLFGEVLSEILSDEADDMQDQLAREEAYRRKVLKAFFEYGRLKTIPAQQKKKRICLEEIAKSFEMGTGYPEKQVNEILMQFHEDYCTLRRWMVAEGIMTREDGIYVRTE